MPIKRINEFPDGSGSLSNDDVFLFMDDPSGNGVTKKISLSNIADAIGSGPGGNPFDQDLNTTDSPQFAQISIGTSGDYLTNLVAPNATEERTITFPDANGTVVLFEGGGNEINPPFGEVIVNGYVMATQFNVNNGGEYTQIQSEATAIRTITLPDANGTVVLADENGLVGSPGTTTLKTQDIIEFNPPNGYGTVTFAITPGYGGTITLPDANGTVVLDQNGYITNPGASALTTPTLNLDSNMDGNITSLMSTATQYRQIMLPDANGTLSLETIVVGLEFNSTLETDASSGNIFDVTLTDNVTLANPTNPVNGKTLRWRITQDGSGNRSVALGDKFVIPSSATSPLPWSTDPNKMDVLAATYHAGRDKWDVVAFVPGY